jgi:hypothetical protein
VRDDADGPVGVPDRNISGAQRLPNGNTLITAGAGGRTFEVTAQGAIVWEYMLTGAGVRVGVEGQRGHAEPQMPSIGG